MSSFALYVIIQLGSAVVAAEADASRSEEVWTEHVQQNISVIVGIVIILLLLLVCLVGRRRRDHDEAKVCIATDTTPQKSTPPKSSKPKAAKDGKPRRKTSDEETEPVTPPHPVSSSSDAKEREGGSGSPKRTRRRKKKRARPKPAESEKMHEEQQQQQQPPPAPPTPMGIEVSDEERAQEEEWTAPRRRSRAPVKPSVDVDVDFVMPVEAVAVLEPPASLPRPPPSPSPPPPPPPPPASPPSPPVTAVTATAHAPAPAPLPTPELPPSPPMQTWAALPDRSSINIEPAPASGSGFRPGGTAASFSSNLTLGHFMAATTTSPKRRNGRQRPTTARTQADEVSPGRRDDSGFLSVSGEQDGVWGGGLSGWNPALEVPPTVDESAGSGGGVLTQAVQFYQSHEPYQFELEQARVSGEPENEVEETILEEEVLGQHAAVMGQDRQFVTMPREAVSEERQDIIDNITSLIMTPDMQEERPTAVLFDMMHGKKEEISRSSGSSLSAEEEKGGEMSGWDIEEATPFQSESISMQFAAGKEQENLEDFTGTASHKMEMNLPTIPAELAMGSGPTFGLGLSLGRKEEKAKDSESSSGEDEALMAEMSPITADLDVGSGPSFGVGLSSGEKETKKEEKAKDSESSSDEDEALMAEMSPITADLDVGSGPSFGVGLTSGEKKEEKPKDSESSSDEDEALMAEMSPITADLDEADSGEKRLGVKEGSVDSEKVESASTSMSSYELVEEEMVADYVPASEVGAAASDDTAVVRSSVVVDVSGDFPVASAQGHARTGLIVERSQRASSVESWSETELQLHPVNSTAESVLAVDVNGSVSTPSVTAEISTLVPPAEEEDLSRRRQRFVELTELSADPSVRLLVGDQREESRENVE